MSIGERYRFEAAGVWYDAAIRTDAAGYPSPTPFFRLLARFRRRPRDTWFALIGAIGQDESTTFLIGKGGEMDITADGILHCYANDLSSFYGNNSGWLTDLSQFASIPQPKCMKLGESWAKVFTTAKAGWESLLRG